MLARKHDRVSVIASLACLLAAVTTSGAEPTAPARELKVYALERASARQASELVEAMFPDLAVQFDERKNLLIVHGTHDQLKTLEALIQVLDGPAADSKAAPPTVVEIQLALIRQARAQAPDEQQAAGEWGEFNADAVLDGEADLPDVVLRDDFRLRTVSGQEATLQTGGTESIVEGRAPDMGTRTFRNVYQQRHVGTIVRCLSEVRESGEIAVTYTFEMSRSGEVASPDAPAPMETLQANSMVVLSPGRAALIGGFQSVAENGDRSRTLLLIRAAPERAEKRGEK